MSNLLEARIVNGEIRCPYCGKKHGELSGNETVIGYKILCKGNKFTGKHYFILNFKGGNL